MHAFSLIDVSGTGKFPAEGQEDGGLTMRRREFLAEALSLLTVAATTSNPALAAPGRPKVKITDVQVKRVRVVKELGSVAPPPGSRGPGRAYRVGGDTITLIHTDAGLTGLGPGVNAAVLSIARERLIGADPLDAQRLARLLYNPAGVFNSVGNGANVEIALWDLVGKVLELPLYRLWGGRDGKLMPYASQWSTGTPDERARMAQTVRAHNWRAIKFRSHFLTVKEDVALVEQTRKLMGEDFIIICDANQAGEDNRNGCGGRCCRRSAQKHPVERCPAFDAGDIRSSTRVAGAGNLGR